MKGVILTGGTGSRLFPLTKAINKNLLPVGNLPLIYYPIQTLKSGGITDILIITGTEHMGAIVHQLGSGSDLGCSFTYRVQDHPNGIAAAVKLAKDFVYEDSFAVILGDNVFLDDVGNDIKSFSTNYDESCRLFLKQVKDPERFGVVKFDSEMKIESIHEKPADPPSNWAVTGLYLYRSCNFFRLADNISPSARGEYEISHVNDLHIQESLHNEYFGKVGYRMLSEPWIDAGTFESYHKVNKLIIERAHK